jgi:hypothetical protein
MFRVLFRRVSLVLMVCMVLANAMTASPSVWLTPALAAYTTQTFVSHAQKVYEVVYVEAPFWAVYSRLSQHAHSTAVRDT